MNKKFKFWRWVLAWLILAILSCFVRLYPLQWHSWDVAAYTPLFAYILISLAFLWVCRVLNYSVIASFIGALFLVMAPINLKHGSLGWFGPDPYNILFSLLLLGCLFLGLRPASKKDGYLWGVIFGFTLFVYALLGTSWGLLFLMGITCALGAAAHNYFIKKDLLHARQNLLFLGLFIGTNLLAVSLCFPLRGFFSLFTSVGALQKTSFENIIISAGGPIFILLAMGGWFYSLRMAIQHFRQTRTIDTLILTIFLIVTMTLSLNWEKLVLFTTIPLSVLAAAASHRFISLRSVGLPLAGLLIALVLFTANHDIRTVLAPIHLKP